MNTIMLYRALKLSQLNVLNPASLGLCWTSDYDKAFPYGYKRNIDSYHIYVAKVSSGCIDEGKTALMSQGEFSLEREVVLKPGVDIEVIRIDQVTIFPPIRIGEGWKFKKEVQTININFKTKT